MYSQNGRKNEESQKFGWLGERTPIDNHNDVLGHFIGEAIGELDNHSSQLIYLLEYGHRQRSPLSFWIGFLPSAAFGLVHTAPLERPGRA